MKAKAGLALALVLALVAAGWWWTQRPPAPIEHVVVRGDTLSKLAARYDVTVDELRAWNGLTGDRIDVDQVLLIHLDEPPEATTPAPTRAKTSQGRPRATTAKPADGTPTMPTPEPCVELVDDLGEEGMVASAGLDRTQVKAALDPVLQRALSCPSGDATEVRIVYEITVGCDGLVDTVRVEDDDFAPPEFVDCVADTLRYADFPAHDMPDGMTFQYPVTASW